MMAAVLKASGRIARTAAFARDTQRVSRFSLAAQRFSLRHAALGRETVTAVPLFAGSRFMPSRAAAAGVNFSASDRYMVERSGRRFPPGRIHQRPFFGIPNLRTCRGANASVFFQFSFAGNGGVAAEVTNDTGARRRYGSLGCQFIHEPSNDIRQRLEPHICTHPTSPKLRRSAPSARTGFAAPTGIGARSSRSRKWTRSLPQCRKFVAITHRLLGEKRP